MQSISLISTQSSSESALITPSKVICIGRNYVEHIHELANEIPDEMVVFVKPNSAISQQLVSAHLDEALHYEAELCFLYQQGKFTAVALGLDLTKRSKQASLKAKGLPWERAKAFDASAVFSDFVSIEDLKEREFQQLSLVLDINGSVRQQGGVALMMFKPDEILQELQTFITLQDGDIVMTGTPKGVGVINKGDEFSGKVIIGSNTESQYKSLLERNWLAK